MTALSFIAVLINPYHWHVYRVVLELAGESVPFRLVTELSAPDFRSPYDYIVVVIALCAAFALGRVPMRSMMFAAVLLVSATLLSLRTARDEWLVVVVGSLVIAAACARLGLQPVNLPRAHRFAVVAVAVVLLFAMAKARGLSNAHLAEQVASVFPARAADVVAQRRLSGPLYNDFEWGGYLAWRLPNLPVSMDGRTNVHGDARIARSVATWNCLPGWDIDPELASARLVIGQTQQVLSSALKSDPKYQLVYRDATAVVFVKVTD